MKWKKSLVMLATFIVEGLITYFIAAKFSVRFIEVMFFTGLVFTVISFYFSSSGGTLSNFASSQAGAQTGLVQKREELFFKRGPIFTASAIFLVIGLVFLVLLISGKIPPAK